MDRAESYISGELTTRQIRGSAWVTIITIKRSVFISHGKLRRTDGTYTHVYACAYVHIIHIPVLFETRIYVSTCCPSLLSTARSKGPRICVRSTHTPACTWDSRFLKARRVLAREDDEEGGEGWKEERGEGQRREARTAYKKKETKKRRNERREGKTEKDGEDKKKIAEEIDGEKSEGREGEKRIASSRPQQRTQHPWLVLSHARIRFAPSEFQGLSTALFPKCLRIKR